MSNVKRSVLTVYEGGTTEATTPESTTEHEQGHHWNENGSHIRKLYEISCVFLIIMLQSILFTQSKP